MTAATIQFTEKLQILFQPARYKVLYGGRGGSKSWGCCRALLILGSERQLRILCTREIQKSIKDSVHRLLSDQIHLLGLTGFYEVLETEIRGKNGTLFIFAGLHEHTVSSIKSFEGCDIAFCEEAQVISKKSWEILIPTIRKPGSEIWISFNPELDTDETYLRFVQHPPPNSQVVHLSYRDNPWFTAELEAERHHAQVTLSKDDYAHIWEGKPRSAAEGAIFAHEVAEMVLEGRLTNLPYDPRLKVHVVLDLGWNDKTAVGYWQRGLSDIRAIHYHEYQFKRIDEVAADLKRMSYNWGYVFVPWDGWITQRQTGKTDADIFRSFGFQVKPIPNVIDAEQTRIRALRGIFRRIYADQMKCARLVECWKRYKRNIPKHGEPTTPVHDEFSHGCDMSGYMALVVEQMINEDESRPRIPTRSRLDESVGALDLV